ncbi:MAG: transposase domain-containing protein [Chloroflexota bacterium]|nr:transposase domain-containing protein [Chloroflexota bacterium]
MDVDDKVCDHVDVTLLGQVYPKETIEQCVGQSQPWTSKRRRVRQSTLLALVWLIIGMALWSRGSQRLVWQKLVGPLHDWHPGQAEGLLWAAAVSGRGKEVGSEGLQALMSTCCRPLASREGVAALRLRGALPTDGPRRDALQRCRYPGQRSRLWSQQQSIGERSLSSGAGGAAGRDGKSCRDWTATQWLRGLGGAWGASVA